MRHSYRVLAAVALLAGSCGGADREATTTSTRAAPATLPASVSSTTLPPHPEPSLPSSTPVPTTTDPAPPPVAVDIVIAGDGLGAIGAAVQAGRRGHDVVMLSPLGYVGGQATAAGVTSFDEASGPARELFRSSGLYAELFESVEAHYAALGLSTSACYFNDANTFCPEPHVVRSVLTGMLHDAGVQVVVDDVAEVTRDGGAVTGVVTATGTLYGGLVVDGTEFGDLIPLTGAAHGIGNHGDGPCVQDMTHAAVMSWYPAVPDQLIVPEDAIDVIARTMGRDTVDDWLDEFRSLVAIGGLPEFPGWRNLTYPIDPDLAVWYRGMPDSRPEAPEWDRPVITVTGVNLANDVAVPAAAVAGGPARLEVYRTAALKTYLYLWYDRWELGREQWSVASHLGYDDTPRHLWLDEIPDSIERHLPPGYYVREARRLVGPGTMLGEETVQRGIDVYPGSVLLGGDRSDDEHGDCPVTDSVVNPVLGPYDAPLRIFIPADVDGFLVAVARNGNVDRAVSSSIRMHPPELLGGQAVGMLAALATEQGVAPRAVPVDDVRAALVAAGAVIDVPGP